MRLLSWFFGLAILATTLSLRANPVVNLGHYYLVDGFTQTASLSVSDAGNLAVEDIEGLTFTLQIAAGASITPTISSVDFQTGTIWSGHVSAGNVIQAAGGNQPQFQSFTLFTNAAGDYVNANGTLATVTFSASGAAPGDYPLKLIGTKDLDGDSQFTDGNGNLVPATLGNGTLTVIAPFDVNGDGSVTVADVSALMGALADLNGFQTTKNLTSIQMLQLADVNRDGHLNNADIQSLIDTLANNGGGGSLTAVPEPASINLFFLAALAAYLTLRRRS